jgi:drug/metabolite transporter (DMT)-like permease
MTITWYRFTCAALVLGVVLRVRGTLPALGRLERRHWWLLAAAAAGLSGNYGFYVLGLERTNAGTAQVVIQIAPMLLTLGGIFVFRERFSPWQWVGLGTLVGGLALFSGEQIAHLGQGRERYWAGLACMVVAAVTWAGYGLAQKQLLGRMGSAQIMLCLYVVAAAVFSPLARPAGVLAMNAVQLGALAFCTANMLAAYGTFSEALAHLEASRVSAVLAAVPLATLAVAHLASTWAPRVFTPEPVSATGLVGALLVVTGSLTASLARR